MPQSVGVSEILSHSGCLHSLTDAHTHQSKMALYTAFASASRVMTAVSTLNGTA